MISVSISVRDIFIKAFLISVEKKYVITLNNCMLKPKIKNHFIILDHHPLKKQLSQLKLDKFTLPDRKNKPHFMNFDSREAAQVKQFHYYPVYMVFQCKIIIAEIAPGNICDHPVVHLSLPKPKPAKFSRELNTCL